MATATRRAGTGTCCDEPADAEWGRLPGAEPPLRWWLPAPVFAAAAVVLTLVVVLLVRDPGPRDDPDPAFQRDGLLRSGPALPPQGAGVSFGEPTEGLSRTRAAPAGSSRQAIG